MELIQDIYDFKNLGNYDPNIWNITKGLDCIDLSELPAEVTTAIVSQPLKFLRAMNGPQGSRKEDFMTRLEMSKINMIFSKWHDRVGQSDQNGENLADSQEQLSATDEGAPTAKIDNASPFPYSEEEVQRRSLALPKQFDWRLSGAVTHVRKGASLVGCASSYAFSAVGALEGYQFRRGGSKVLTKLSEQVLIDCSSGYGNFGCIYGQPKFAFDWVKKYGIPASTSYNVYNAMVNSCDLKDVEMFTNITGYVKVPADENALRLAIHEHGPVSARMSFHRDFQNYDGGIYKNPECPRHSSDVMYVMVVGYGEYRGQKYWMVKTDWGKDRGNNGYMMLSAEGNLCGILDEVYYVY